MNTYENQKTSAVLLRDGNIELAEWTQDFETPPTVGDRIDVAGRHSLAGYGGHATVSRIVWDQESGGHRIEVQAECELRDQERPEVFLNASLFAAGQRAAAEQCLRRELGVPLIHWEESFEPRAIVRLHEGKSKTKVPLVALQNELTALARSEPQLAPH